jgi:hypothetical protein
MRITIIGEGNGRPNNPKKTPDALVAAMAAATRSSSLREKWSMPK